MNLLCHYTTIENFFNIINSRSIRLYAETTTSDDNEGKHFIAYPKYCIKKYLHTYHLPMFNPEQINNPSEKLPYLQEKANNDSIRREFLMRYDYSSFGNKFYFFSLSQKEDSLSQWRAFSDNGKGVSLAFKEDHLIQSFKNIGFEICRPPNHIKNINQNDDEGMCSDPSIISILLFNHDCHILSFEVSRKSLANSPSHVASQPLTITKIPAYPVVT